MERYLELLKKLDLRRDYGTAGCFMVMIADCDKESFEAVADGQIVIMHRRENVDDMLRGMSGINLLAVFSDKGDDLSKEQYKQIEDMSVEARKHLLPFSFFGDKDELGIYMFDISYFLKKEPDFIDVDGHEVSVSDVVNIGQYMYTPTVVFEAYSKADRCESLGIYSLPLPSFLEKVNRSIVPDTSECYVVNV